MGVTEQTKVRENGFTIVELLIVVVVIAILAAITMVAYNGIQNRAHDTAVANDLSAMAKKIQVFNTENGRYPQGTTDMNSLGLRLAKGSYSRGMFNGSDWYNIVYCWPNSANPDRFAIIAQSKSNKVYAYENGRVFEPAYSLSGSDVTCNNAGVNISTSGRNWFYENDGWASYAG